MKKGVAIITAVVVLTVTGMAFAQMDDKGKGTMGDKVGMMGMMQQMHTNMVASSDGGVIVLSGGKLIKYDNQLNVVKQVDLPKPEMGMMGDKGMMDMMKMCQQMMGNGANSGNKTPAADADEHAAHHSEQ